MNGGGSATYCLSSFWSRTVLGFFGISPDAASRPPARSRTRVRRGLEVEAAESLERVEAPRFLESRRNREDGRRGGAGAPRPFSPRRRARDAPRVTSARADRERRDTTALDTHRKVRAGRSSRPPRAHDPPRVPSRSPRADVSRRAPFASPRRDLGKRPGGRERVARRVSFGRTLQHPAHPSPSPPLAAPERAPRSPSPTAHPA